MINLNNAVLKEFYCELEEWINEGCPHHEVFNPMRALCSTLLHWSRNKQHNWKVTNVLYTLQQYWFIKECGINSQYPFGKESYRVEAVTTGHYTNQKRLNFIRSMMRVL